MTHHRKHASVPQSGTTGRTNATQTVVTCDKGKHAEMASAEVIRLCAFRKWESAGKPAGEGIQFWLEAEQELMNGK